MKEELGDRFTISMETTYRTTIRFIVGTLATEFINSRKLAAAAAAQGSSFQTQSPDGNDVAKPKTRDGAK